ncbi:AAA family ATPase [Bradyrhizobium sp. cir1]|uniref:AAA family ATPase n=1 Tax=Bradyrhizobium sp. cir1 TaxID=1445730 RepID=UPI0024C027D8|nr:AAA family ATPase [Bradyrhizobium sp. cir1]
MEGGAPPWSAVSSGVALEGPAGCGKMTFASVFCAEAGLYMVGDANLAAWQSSGEGHLGHLLRAMKKSFDEARANAPACIFIDECDSIGRRDAMAHSHRDDSIQVVNAVLAEIDGVKGREGVLIVGCSNDLSRCDPALLRAGRLDKIIRIGFPDVTELERMFRVRLQSDLLNEDLTPLAELSLGMVGADVERIVKDARRVARGGQRPLSMRDLLGAVGDGEELDDRTRRRAAIHEAAHIVADVVLFGPDGVHAVLTNMRDRTGAVVRHLGPELEGTYADYHRRLQVLLAGRVGEHMLCGSISHGAGGRRGSDLEKAAALAASMVGSLGLAGWAPLLYLGGTDETDDLLSFRGVRTAANAELEKADRAVRSLLARHRAALETVAITLFDRGRINGTAVASILASTRTNVAGFDPAARTMPP